MAFQIPEYGDIYPVGVKPGLIKVTDESQDVAYNAASPVTIGTLKANKSVMILGVIADIKTAFVGTTPTLTIGVSGDAARYGSNTEIVATVAGAKRFFCPGTETTLEEAPAADQAIIVTIGGTSLTAGNASFRLLYIENDNLS